MNSSSQMNIIKQIDLLYNDLVSVLVKDTIEVQTLCNSELSHILSINDFDETGLLNDVSVEWKEYIILEDENLTQEKIEQFLHICTEKEFSRILVVSHSQLQEFLLFLIENTQLFINVWDLNPELFI